MSAIVAMSRATTSPAPQRSTKRLLEDPELATPAKRMRYTPPLPTSSSHDQGSLSPAGPAERPNFLQLVDDIRGDVRDRGNVLTTVQAQRLPRSASAPPLPRCKDQNTSARGSRPGQPVEAWLSGIAPSQKRADSAPPDLDLERVKEEQLRPGRVSLAALKRMSRRNSQTYGDGQASISGLTTTPSQVGRPAVSDPGYRDVLRNNLITLDIAGEMIPQDLQAFLDTDILKERTDQLSGHEVAIVIQTASELAEVGENQRLLSSPMFPFQHLEITSAGPTVLWNSIAVPRGPFFQYGVVTPKPDFFLGYSRRNNGGWSLEQYATLAHNRARPYTQPTTSNNLPFLVLEVKSEPYGGTLWAAENQAASGGSHSVNSMAWLLQEAHTAGLDDVNYMIDTIAFSFCVTHREALLYCHWRPANEKVFYMSFLDSFSTFRPVDIRACNRIVKNILDWSLTTRKQKITSALEALTPAPPYWDPPLFTGSSTPLTSQSGENKRPAEADK